VLTGHAPFLVVPDVAAALDYYRDVLAFEVEAYDLVPEDYGTATRDGCTIFFNRGHALRRVDRARRRPPAQAV
jgi:catechol 2,3-dioxygenase-like lactoylglutathione lyase family enzyme